MTDFNSDDFSIQYPVTQKSPTCWTPGKVFVTFGITLWTLITWIFTGYMIYDYIIHPNGPWNILPNLCCESIQKIPLYMHIIGATLMLIIGPFQLTNSIYKTRVHRYTGVLYILGAILASFGGILFMMFNGTVGGNLMTIPFTIYGILVFFSAAITMYLGIKKDINNHRPWAFRMYVIGSSSVFYRILYFLACFWRDCNITFDSPMDYVFNWLFFLLPILIVEIWLLLYSRISCSKDKTGYIILPKDPPLDGVISNETYIYP